MEQNISVSATGGRKEVKPEAYSLIPAEPLAELARVYGYGASKYAPHNWENGYEYSKSIDSLMRHLEAWRCGEVIDAETGCHHLASVVFHAFALQYFEKHFPQYDDRLFPGETPDCFAGS